MARNTSAVHSPTLTPLCSALDARGRDLAAWTLTSRTRVNEPLIESPESWPLDRAGQLQMFCAGETGSSRVSAGMLLSTLAALALASPDLPAAPDATRICTAEGRVALDPVLRGRTRGLSACPNLVSSEDLANFLKAFAVRTRELAEPEIAAQLTRTLKARWLLLRDGGSYQVFDAETAAFVDPALFAAGPAQTTEETPAELAYRQGYQALRGKRWDEARAQLTACLTHDADHVGCHWELGWVHWMAEDWAAAAASWSAVEQRSPDHPDLRTWLPKAKAKAEAEPSE